MKTAKRTKPVPTAKATAKAKGWSRAKIAELKSIIEAHGGTISVKSKEGEGTTFRFTVPKAK